MRNLTKKMRLDPSDFEPKLDILEDGVVIGTISFETSEEMIKRSRKMTSEEALEKVNHEFNLDLTLEEYILLFEER